MTTFELLSYLRSLDVRLWVAGDRLRCNAPDGVLMPALRAELAERKAEIVAFLCGVKDTVHSASAPILPTSRDGELPLSFGQQRLWFPDQLELSDPAYNIPAAVRVTGPLKVAALEQSLNEIVRRHEVLRTTFVTVDGRPAQVIASALTLPLPVMDLRALPKAEREAGARRLAMEEAQQSFDLAQGPLFRAGLLQMGAEEHVLLLTMHHIISDDWSIGILVRELATLYQAFSAGGASPLPSLPVQYVDFAVWERQWLQGEVLDVRLSYWKERLGDAPRMLELPSDHPRQPVQTFRGERRSLVLSKASAEALEALSQQEGVTLFMTLLAAFKVLLHRYTGQTDIVVGTAIASRNRAEVQGLIGFFVNTLVLRTDLSGNPTFREVLDRIQEATLGAYAHQDLPFVKLVEELQPERDLSRTPLFQVFFNMLHSTFDGIEFQGLKIEPLSALVIGSPAIGAKFDLTLYVIEHKECIQLDISYNADLFEEAAMVGLLEYFQSLLEGIVANPNQRLSAFPRAVVRKNDDHR